MTYPWPGDADANSFEVDGTVLYLKADTVLDYETKNSYALTINVDDETVGNTPDVTTNFTLEVTHFNEAPTTGLAIAATNASQTEGNTDTKALTITRSGNTTSTNAVSWAVTGTETNPANPEDFGGTLPTGSVTFNPGDTSRLITVYVTGDTTVEADETFTVKLSNPTNSAIITTTTAIGTIQNDDAHTSVILDMKGGVDDYFISS